MQKKKRNVDKKMFKIWIRDVIDHFFVCQTWQLINLSGDGKEIDGQNCEVVDLLPYYISLRYHLIYG